MVIVDEMLVAHQLHHVFAAKIIKLDVLAAFPFALVGYRASGVEYAYAGCVVIFEHVADVVEEPFFVGTIDETCYELVPRRIVAHDVGVLLGIHLQNPVDKDGAVALCKLLDALTLLRLHYIIEDEEHNHDDYSNHGDFH